MKKFIFLLIGIFLISNVYAVSWGDGTTTIINNINQTANLTNVAFLNNTQTFTQNNTFAENVSILDTLFSLFIGSLSNPITGLWGTTADFSGDVNVSGNLEMDNGLITTVHAIDFNLTSNASHSEGRIHWNDNDKTLDIDTNIVGVSLQVGQENYLFARNNLGFTITNGQLVYVDGALGGRPTVALAKADAEETSQATIAMATHDCLDANTCFFTTNGLVRDLDTSAFTANDSIFLSPSVAGNFTNVEPEAPNHSVRLGHVLRSNANDGVVHLNIQNGFELDELHDAHYPITPVDGNILVWNDTNSRWENGNIINNNLTITDRIFLDDEGHYIKLGMEEDTSGSGIANESFSLHHPEGHTEGKVLFVIDNSDDVNLWVIKRVNGSASGISNSWMVFPDNDLPDKKNMSTIPIIIQRWVNYGIQPTLSYFSAINETSIASLFGIETQKIVFHNDLGNGGLLGEGTFDMTLDGNDANFFNGSIHNFIPVNFTSGFEPGDPFTSLSVIFAGSINPFINLDVSPEVWFITSGALCDEGECAESSGSTGSSDITMTHNFSTQNVNETRLNFVYSLFNLIGADNLRAETNNFTGTGWEVQFTDSGTDTTVSQSIALGEDYSNLSVMGLRFVCDVTQLGRNCFVDTVKVNGTFTANTTAPVNDFDTEICGADGSRDVNGNCNVGIRWDAETAQWHIAGTLNATGTITGGISGSGTTNNWVKFISSTSIGNAPISDDGVTIITTLPLEVIGQINSSDWSNVSGSQINNDLNWINTTQGNLIFNQTDLILSVNITKNIQELLNLTNIYSTFNATYLAFNSSINLKPLLENQINSTSWLRTGTNVFLRNSGDSVGIGSSSPETELEVRGGTGIDGGSILTLSSAETTIGINYTLGTINFQAPLESSGTDAILPAASIRTKAFSGFSSGQNRGKLIFATSSSGNPIDRMFIDHNGNVGIGFTAELPDGFVHIKKSNTGASVATSGDTLIVEENAAGGISILTPDASTGSLFFGSPGETVGAIVQWNHDAGLMTIETSKTGANLSLGSGNGVEAMRIDSLGNVGIGIPSPDNPLSVNGSIQYLSKTESVACTLTARDTCAGNEVEIGTDDGVSLCLECNP